MATVTIEKSYLDALVRRAEFHTSIQDARFPPNLSNNVTISKKEHDRLLQSLREYHLLKSALFRGGLTNETLETLLKEESEVTVDDHSEDEYQTARNLSSMNGNRAVLGIADHKGSSQCSNDFLSLSAGRRTSSYQRTASFDQPNSFDSKKYDGDYSNDGQQFPERILLHDQRTVFITNLPERTTHKDLTNVIRGGRLLDIFLRHDRSASVSFVDGAADFLSYAKRNDIYLYSKRLEFRWADRQFHVPKHVSNKIAGGATRNLVVRGGAARVSIDQVRDHLDHIHNLVVIDINSRNGDLYISTNSIHNALFARTCMMSRTAYRGLRVEYCPDECAVPLPRPAIKLHNPAPLVDVNKASVKANTYALLDTGSEVESDSENESYITEGNRIYHHTWTDATVA